MRKGCLQLCCGRVKGVIHLPSAQSMHWTPLSLGLEPRTAGGSRVKAAKHTLLSTHEKMNSLVFKYTGRV